ncbi:MAG TPA: hypothetical protein VNP04_00350 [Alphaproteobacteria bacterium]|nr:hypothetical protein [Alphaproteobacteria bacterium]
MQTRNEMAQTLAERLYWEIARRYDSRIARRLYHKQEVDEVYRLDEEAVLDDGGFGRGGHRGRRLHVPPSSARAPSG